MRYLLTFVFSILVSLSFAQIGPGGVGEITGPSTADVGDVDTYTITGDFESPSWTVSSGATATTRTLICFPADECVRITWNTAGTKTISFLDNGVVIKTKTVTVYAPPPATPTATTTSNAGCQSTTITRTNNPPSGVRWYWQTSPSGTSTSLGYGTSITRTVGGPIYLRARSATITYNWSTSSQTISFPYNSAIPALVSGSDVSRCGSGSITLNATPGTSGNTIRWYTTPSGGSHVHTGNSYTRSNLTTTTTYYAASYNSSTTCEDSDRKAITAIINPIPGNATGSGTTRCGSGVVTLSATPGSNGNSIRWYSGPSGGSVLHTGTTYTTPSISTNTTYYAASYHTSTTCESGYRRPITASIDTPTSTGTLSGETEEFGVASGTLTLGGTITGNVTKWQYRTTGSWIDTLVTNTSLGYVNLQETREYRALVKNGVCDEVASNAVQITILEIPDIDLGAYQEIRPDGTTTLTASSGHSNYRWFKDNVQIQNGSNNQLVVVEPDVYKVEVTSSGGAVYTTGNAIISSQLDFSKNAVVTYTYREATQDNSDPFAFSTSQQSISAKIYDGLGRTIQQVAINSSPLKQDIVAPVEYDEFGRNTKSYLPYVAGVSAVHKSNALNENYNLSDHRNYYMNTSSHASDKAFAEVSFEASPLNRPVEQGAAGTQWQLGQNTVLFDYNAADTIEVISFDYANLLTDAKSFYASGELHENTITDEDGNQTVEYTNKQGQTILKKSKVNTTTWAETYYLYDVYGQLVVVLPPEAAARLDTEFYGQTQQARTDFLNTWAFLYDYDGRNRMTMKKVPGADTVLMVHDQWDRLVLTQDGVQCTTNTWLFTKYDQLNRPIMTGLMSGGSEEVERAAVAAETDRYETFSSTGVNEYTDDTYPSNTMVDEYLTVTYYDHYDWDTTGLAFTNPTGLALNVAVKGQVTGTLTSIGGGSFIKSVSYYDDKYRVIQTQSTNHLNGTDVVTNYYDFIGQVTQSISHHHTSDTTFSVTRSFVYDHAGRLLETWHQMDDGPEVLLSKNEYNELGELIEKDLHINGDSYIHFDSLQFTGYHSNDMTPNNWNLSNKTLTLERGNTWKKYPLDYTITSNTILEFEYKSDHEGEIHGIGMDTDDVFQAAEAFKLHGTQSIGSVSTYSYTVGTGWKKFSIPIGQHMSGQKDYITFIADDDAASDAEAIFRNVRLYEDGQPEQSLDYTYNIRGWLTSINGSDITSSADDDLFGMELFYDEVDPSGDISNSTYFNGNIGAMKWSTYNDEEWAATTERGYRFTYDGLNRLVDAQGDLGQSSSWNQTNDYRGEYWYDLNGNIHTLRRRDMKNNFIDSLTYTYGTAGNQLLAVADAADSIGFHDRNTLGNDYAYDANGNMVKDRNKAIDSIYYNHLNLPVKVAFEASGDSIIYWYDAAGIKLQQVVYQAGDTVKVTDYVGEFIYETDTSGTRKLQLIQHEEGRIVPKSPFEGGEGVVYDYQYHLKDHLGNVRLTFSTTPESYTMVETFETGEENGWQDLHRHTNSNANTTIGGDEVERLQSGETGAMVFLSVNKGDTINLTVQANYENAPTGNTFLGTAYNALFNSFDNVYGGSEGVTSTSSDFNDALSGTEMAGKSGSTAAPRAFLNFIFFDADMSFVNAGFTQISTAAQGVGVHETIVLDVPVADREGYILAYLSNENQEAVNIHWDDFTVYHGKTNVVSMQDYYPFGLTFNESVRVASKEQRFKYNGFEYMDDLGFNLFDYQARYYDPELGRFIQVDPLTEAMRRWTPYAYAFNNPVRFIDPDGMMATDPNDDNNMNDDINAGVSQGIRNRVSGFFSAIGDRINNPSLLLDDAKGTINGINNLLTSEGSLAGKIADGISNTVDAKLDRIGNAENPANEFGQVLGETQVDVMVAAGTEGATGLGGKGAGLIEDVADFAGDAASTSKKIHGNSVDSPNPSGHYEIEFESGKTYNGVGPESRMNASANRISKANGDNVSSTSYSSTPNRREAYIGEHIGIQRNGGAGNVNRNYNKINSPGKALYEAMIRQNQ